MKVGYAFSIQLVGSAWFHNYTLVQINCINPDVILEMYFLLNTLLRIYDNVFL